MIMSTAPLLLCTVPPVFPRLFLSSCSIRFSSLSDSRFPCPPLYFFILYNHIKEIHKYPFNSAPSKWGALLLLIPLFSENVEKVTIMIEDCLLYLRCCDYYLTFSQTYFSMIIVNVHFIIMHNSQVPSSYHHFHYKCGLTCGLSHTSINLFFLIPHHFPISLHQRPPTDWTYL